MRCILVPGTHAAYRGHDEQEWWFPGVSPGAAMQPASPFVDRVLRPLGFTPTVFKWSTDLDGTRFWPWQWFAKPQLTDWRSWADAFAERLQAMPLEERIILAHSHGENVAAMAIAQVPVRLFIGVAGPVRLGDLADDYRRARIHTERWIHIHSDRDRMQRWGSYFDGHVDLFGKVRANPYAHENVFVPRRGHSQILNDPDAFTFWGESGIAGHLADCLVFPPKDAA